MLRKSLLAKLSVAAGIAMFSACASAQSTGLTGASARIGVFLPTGTVGEYIGHTWFGVGLDYKLSSVAVEAPTGYAGAPSYLGVSLDYYEQNGAYNIPLDLTYNLKFHGYTFSAGVGPELDKYGGGGSSVSFGGQLAVSHDITKLPVPIFLQAKYFLAGKNQFRGFGLYAGVHF